jgi:dihydroorotate dehydrogenase electron transfer subunit
LVGGGLGVAPLLFAAEVRGGDRADAVLGFRAESWTILKQDFEQACRQVRVITDDGSNGNKGTVVDELAKFAKFPYKTVLVCGPRIMMQKVTEFFKDKDVDVQVSLEEHMACGIGACKSCTAKVGGKPYTTCSDGPVFDGRKVVW